MPEVTPQYETSFQNMVDHEYSGKANPGSVTATFPNGNFGITPGAIPPRWTLTGLAKELAGEYDKMTKNTRAMWDSDYTQVLGIIQQTVNIYAGILGDISKGSYSNTTPEWDAWVEANAKA